VLLVIAIGLVAVLPTEPDPNLGVERCESLATEEAGEVYQERLGAGANETTAHSEAIDSYRDAHRRCFDRIQGRLVGKSDLDPGASVSWDVYRGSEVSCVLSVETRIRSADGVMIESPSREVSHWYHANRTSERVILRGLNWTAYAVDLDAGTVTRLSTARVDDDCRWTIEGVSA
jgi:hypothetical protein